MKIFISWSGKHSLHVATTLRDWLPYIFNGIELFVSSEDIRKGKRWPLEVSKELDASNFGIVCLTRDNLEAPWLLFEAGALSKSVKEASVFTLLVGGLKMSDIEGPLSHFQHTVFEKEDFFKLVLAINANQKDGQQDEARLRKIFEKFWDELEASISQSIKPDSKPEKKRSQDEKLDQLLDLTTYIAKRMADSPDAKVAEPLPESDSLWPILIANVKKKSPFTAGYLREALSGQLADKTLTILFPADSEIIELVDNPRNVKLIQSIVASLGYDSNCNVIFKTESRLPLQSLPPTKR